jgi:hypothetical protein
MQETGCTVGYEVCAHCHSAVRKCRKAISLLHIEVILSTQNNNNNNSNNNNNNNNKLQLVCHPVVVVILHVKYN